MCVYAYVCMAIWWEIDPMGDWGHQSYTSQPLMGMGDTEPQQAIRRAKL